MPDRHGTSTARIIYSAWYFRKMDGKNTVRDKTPHEHLRFTVQNYRRDRHDQLQVKDDVEQPALKVEDLIREFMDNCKSGETLVIAAYKPKVER